MSKFWAIASRDSDSDTDSWSLEDEMPTRPTPHARQVVRSDDQDDKKREARSEKDERNMADTTFAQGRLEQDLKDIQKQAIEVYLVNDNMFHWEVVIEGPSGTIYVGCTYTIHLNFPNNYPFEPPKVTFIPCIVHPNVSENGELLIASFLPSGDDRLTALPNLEKWSPTWTVEKVVKQIIKVLEEPDPYMIVNDDAAVIFHTEPEVNGSKKKEEGTHVQKGAMNSTVEAMNSKLKDEGSVEEATVEAMNSKLKDEGSVEEATVEAMNSKLKDEGSVGEATVEAMNNKLKNEESVKEATVEAMNGKLKDEGSVGEATVEAMNNKLKNEESVKEATVEEMNSKLQQNSSAAKTEKNEFICCEDITENLDNIDQKTEIETPKMFTLKKWNAVAMWSWDVKCDNCAICRVGIMNPCLNCQTKKEDAPHCVVVWGDCNHSFHNCCMQLWVKQNNRCPLCQQDWAILRIGN